MVDVWPRCPFAEWRPWKDGYCYKNAMDKAHPPIATVQHVMAGFLWNGWDWPERPPRKVSWHFTVQRDGKIMQHLRLQDGGWHAGVRDSQTFIRPPTWPLWKGPGINVNKYTIGIEAEGIPYNDSESNFTEPQMKSIKRLHEWIASTIGYELSENTIPAHGIIDIVNRVADWDYPKDRKILLDFILKGKKVKDKELREQFETLNKYMRMRETIRNVASAVTPEDEAFMRKVFNFIVNERRGDSS